MKDTTLTIKEQVAPIISEAMNLKIDSTETLTKATEFLSRLNKANDAVVAEREKVTKPLNEALKAERARWKPIEVTLSDVISSIRIKMSQYQTAVIKAQREKEELITSKVEAGKLKPETAIKKINALEEVESVSTDSGMVKFKTVKSFRVDDLSKLPIGYHLADEVGIRKAMQSGIELPGVTYYEEQVPVNFR